MPTKNTKTSAPTTTVDAQALEREAISKLEEAKRAGAALDADAAAALEAFDRAPADPDAIAAGRMSLEVATRRARAHGAVVEQAEREHAEAQLAATRAELADLAPRLDVASARTDLADLAARRQHLVADHERAIRTLDERAASRIADREAAIVRTVELAAAVDDPSPDLEHLTGTDWAIARAVARFDAADAAGKAPDLRAHVAELRQHYAPNLAHRFSVDPAGTLALERSFPLNEQRALLLRGAGLYAKRIAGIAAAAEEERKARVERRRLEHEQKFADVVGYVVMAAFAKSDLNHARAAVLAEVERLHLVDNEELWEARTRCYRATEVEWKKCEAAQRAAAVTEW
jgi:hypothetical protein